MRKINFTKMIASGNDFVIICRFADSWLCQSEGKPLPSGLWLCQSEGKPLPSGLPVCRLKELSRKICDRKYGIGADGLLLLEKSKIANVKMRVFNADGSEAEMCGNGARCSALWANAKRGLRLHSGQATQNAKLNIETKAGIIEARINGNNVKIKLTNPKDIKLDIPIKVNNHLLRVNFINTGVPHTVIFVEGLDKIDVVNLGRQIRYHKKFAPGGANVNFVEVLSRDTIKIRTYERGVEDETLACGTGSVASVLLYALRSALCAVQVNPVRDSPAPYGAGRKSVLTEFISNGVNVHTRSREILKVYFNKTGDGFEDVWLEGEARIVYKGEYYV